jgi:hypothetical protein
MANHFIVLSNQLGDADSSRIEHSFNPPVPLNSMGYEVALTHFACYNSWHNVSDILGNRQFKYYNGTSYVTLELDPGTYSLSSLIQEIQRIIIRDHPADRTLEPDGSSSFDFNFTQDLSSGFVQLDLTNSFKVDFTGMPIRTLFGFNSAEYNQPSQVSEQVADVSAGLRHVQIHLGGITSWKNGRESDLLYTFVPSVAPSALIDIIPGQFHYITLSSKSDIFHMRAYLTDQDGRKLDLNGLPMHVSLHLRPIPKII